MVLQGFVRDFDNATAELRSAVTRVVYMVHQQCELAHEDPNFMRLAKSGSMMGYPTMPLPTIYIVWMWIFNCPNVDRNEVLFSHNARTAKWVYFLTLREGFGIAPLMVEAWSCVLNHREKCRERGVSTHLFASQPLQYVGTVADISADRNDRVKWVEKRLDKDLQTTNCVGTSTLDMVATYHHSSASKIFYKMDLLSSSFYVRLLLAVFHTLQNKMSMLYVLAKDISPQSYKKAIRLRLIRTYIVTEGRNKSAVKSQECVFPDSEGTYVHASIHADFIDQFSHLLKEGKVYAVKNFVAVSYYYQYKTTQHKYMMRFNQNTTIERHRRKGFPSLLFRIKPIEELLASKVEEKLLIDVIGRVVEFYSPKDKVIVGFPTQLVDFLIEDSKGNRIKCTLWDEHVPAVMPFFNNHVDGHLIVLLQLCHEVRISSSYTATKVLFNLDCQEFADFRNSANNSQSPMVVSTIRDLYERVEEGYYYVPEGNVRYKVIVRVLDKTSDAPFVLWDKDCFELLGITAYDLKTKYSMAKMQVPIEFEQLRNKSMVFRINLKNEHIRNPAKPISVLSESESGDEAISPIVQANLKLKGVANDQDEVDTGAIKRCLLDQFSSSQNLKKCRPLVIKEEKTL
nr:replication protein A 70 kDa DNA-binding subunit B-like [Ipomoea batatas]